MATRDIASSAVRRIQPEIDFAAVRRVAITVSKVWLTRVNHTCVGGTGDTVDIWQECAVITTCPTVVGTVEQMVLAAVRLIVVAITVLGVAQSNKTRAVGTAVQINVWPVVMCAVILERVNMSVASTTFVHIDCGVHLASISHRCVAIHVSWQTHI